MNLLTNNLAEVKLSYSSKIPARDRINIKCSRDSDKALRLFWPSLEHREYFYILLLNTSNRILGYSQISMGGISGTITDIRIIFQAAIKSNASAIILAHNHPSGYRNPSHVDLRTTKKIVEAGKIMDIPVLDHIVLTETGYYSMADENQI